MAAAPERRRYDSLVRTAQADETRRQIAQAARRLFVAQGWGRTTVRDVAREAGVSVPTVYSAYGNKLGLAIALMDAADLAADPDRLVAELAAAADPPGQLAVSVAFHRRLFERAGDVILLLREGGRTEPELAAAYREGPRRGEKALLALFSSWPAGTFSDGVDPRTAVDMYGAICGIDAYAELTAGRGWSPERVERWWTELLTRELLG
ncbi:TetR/AcrR family transcriptional regulator [Plantactinospora sp. KLBMP9567]|uniref:TetR/AcrR family transcriptional regulator n=1 Tax=Plantactinospora sp. KLBMP9567 TaxID=3085900 RepID=UPI0029816A03|nr:TetR/AcrR family transcriptional regulator [Plantactinospora sp. KLBMP9567]MDW5326306.1 TetR/AcrR family transcriptional regulator [Plantactinospora sp. KLBMP9567]